MRRFREGNLNTLLGSRRIKESLSYDRLLLHRLPQMLRKNRIDYIRSLIQQNRYETEEKIQKAVARLVDVFVT